MGKGTESLLKQMIEHSKDMPNILQAPYIQSAINFAANNPEYLRTVSGGDDDDYYNVGNCDGDIVMMHTVTDTMSPTVMSL